MKLRFLMVPVVLVVVSVGAAAQTPPSAAPAAGSSRSYTPADFAQFAPKTALDMLNRVPGFSIRQDAQERGLGQATGNVVVNGQRISGKSNDVLTELSRIPAQNVERIDIVDGAALGIAGLSGQVANVIVKSAKLSGQYAYRPEFRAYNTDPLLTRFEVSIGGTRGPVEYTLGLDNRASRSGADGPTRIYDARNNQVEIREERWKANAEQPRISGKLAWDAPASAIGNLSLSYRWLEFEYLETGTRTHVSEGERGRRVTIDETAEVYEIGADYELALGIGRLKLIGLNRSSHVPSETNLFLTSPDRSVTTGFRFGGVGDETERIARSEYRWKGGEAEWQMSVEGAFNSLDNASEFFELLPDGSYRFIPLDGATARVDEDRYEWMTSYGRTLAGGTVLKASLGGEYSQISHRGGATRSFVRPKGELSLAMKPAAHTDLNVKIARRVGQLNFYDFLASVNLGDDTETAANPDLVPQQSWELSVEGVRNLGTLGTTTLRLYGNRIDDIIDYVPIGASGESPGNLDQAIVYGVSSRSTFNLDRAGWAGARLDASLQLQESSVKDPLTGEKRPISNSMQREASLALRHDVPRSDWAWGADASHYYAALNYRLTEVGRRWEGPYWGSVFAEHKDVYGLSVRASIGNVLGARSMWDRTVHAGRRTDPIAFVEERDRRIGPIFSFAIRGKF
jgi:outer membrane receptor for ferrienterochelin and colicins